MVTTMVDIAMKIRRYLKNAQPSPRAPPQTQISSNIGTEPVQKPPTTSPESSVGVKTQVHTPQSNVSTRIPIGKDEVEEMMRSAANALAQGVKAGNAEDVISIVRKVRYTYRLLVEKYGQSWVRNVLAEVLSSLPPYQRKMLEYAIEGKTANIFVLRNIMIADEVAKKLRQAGMDVNEGQVINIIRKTGLDLRKIADEIRDEMEKIMEEGMRKHAFSSSMKDTINRMRLMMAVAIGFNGRKAVEMLSRSFSGKEKQIFDFLAKSTFKPMQAGELVKQLQAKLMKSVPKATSKEEYIKRIHNLNRSTGTQPKHKPSGIEEYMKERMEKMVRHMREHAEGLHK